MQGAMFSSQYIVVIHTCIGVGCSVMNTGFSPDTWDVLKKAATLVCSA
jgi:hypothetical protein